MSQPRSPQRSKHRLRGENRKERSCFLSVILIGIQVLCCGALWLSCFPGALPDAIWHIELLVALCFLWLVKRPLGQGTLVLATVALGVWLYRCWRRSPARPLRLMHQIWGNVSRTMVLVTGVMVLLTSILITLNVPQAIAFSLSRPAFDAFVADETLCKEDTKLQLGLYRIERCVADGQGGVYFQTGGYGLLFNAADYGFVYQPRLDGSGALGTGTYEYYPVAEGWYGFKVAKDW